MVLALTSITEDGIRFETGVPVTFAFMRNTVKAPKSGAEFRQDIEPVGRYMQVLYGDPGKLPPRMEHGVVHFRSPIVLRLSLEGDYVGDGGWKARLSAAYGRKRGKALSSAILRDGHDGIVTVDSYLRANGMLLHGTNEIVDLTVLGSPTQHRGRRVTPNSRRK